MVYRKNPPDPQALRQLAMARLSGRSAGQDAASLDLPQVQRLLEDLEIHQIELELQNEQLNAARAQFEQVLNQCNGLYDFAPVGNLLINTDGNITRLNLAAAQMLASERARLIGARFGLSVAEAQRADLNAMLERARDDHEAQTADLALVANGLEPQPVQAKVVWMGLEAGWQVALVDLTERRRMEDELRASEERLKQALSAVGDSVVDWYVNRDRVVISEGFTPILGISSLEPGIKISDLMVLIHPDDRPHVTQALQNCLSGKSDNFRMEHRFLLEDGSIKWVLGRGSVVLRDADGKVLRVLGTMVDVTRNKQIEADLLTAAQFQNALFDSISAQIAVLDDAGMLVLTNAAWRRYMAEINVREAIGSSYLALLESFFAIDPVMLSTVAAGMKALVAGSVSHLNVPTPIQSRCGRWWFSIRITAVADVAHRMVATHEDVTALKRAELASMALANVDDLTGALSRQNFMGMAEMELVRSQRYALPLVVLMLDLDHFKSVNDSYGHSTGDAVLKGFVQTVKQVLRDSDVIGRIGGEEFAVLLPNTSQEGGGALANRILDAVRARPVTRDGLCVAYTVSIGVSYFTKQNSFGQILAECDAALYRAKKAGRDRLELSWDTSTLPRSDSAPLTTVI